jgi:hypothetical protein
MDQYTDPNATQKLRGALLGNLTFGQCEPQSVPARRHMLLGLHPLEQSRLAVANRAADLDVGRTVAAHARLCEPGEAELKKLGRSCGVSRTEMAVCGFCEITRLIVRPRIRRSIGSVC